MQLDKATARVINNLMPGNQNVLLGDLIRTSLIQGWGRNPDYFYYVKPDNAITGDGLSRETAYLTITEGITKLNTLSGKGATLIVDPGFYIEVAGLTLSASDCMIIANGLPEDTVLFGSGTAGAVAAATDDLLTITGGNNSIVGLGLYNHSASYSSLVFNDTGGGYAGSFNLIKNCYFSPQAQDGVGYCIKYEGGNVNIIEDNFFYGAATAAILLTGNVGNPVRNVIRRNHFVGTAIGVHITSANYNTLIDSNWFSAGSQSGESMTNAITISAGMNAGSVTASRNLFEQSAANDISDSKSGGSVFEMDNSNGA
jgi:hypothetical protein